MIDTSQLGVVDVIVVTFVPVALAATQLRAKGVLGWIALSAIFAICIAAVVSFEGMKQAVGFVSALAGLAAGGKFSDWRALVQAKKVKEGEIRERSARFK